MRKFFIACALVASCFCLERCKQKTTSHTGESLAKTYCTSCHNFPDPSLLDKQTWAQRVLPAMGEKLGIHFYNGMPFTDVHDTTTYALSVSDWQKIIAYYDSLAPAQMPLQQREIMNDTTHLFEQHPLYTKNKFPFTTYCKIDEGNHVFYLASGVDSSLHTYNLKGNQIQTKNLHAVITDVQFDEDMSAGGNRTGVFTDIGILNPNDTQKGSIKRFSFSGDESNQLIRDSIRRPVSLTVGDVNNDGKDDYIVCGFGNNTGEFFYLSPTSNGEFQKHMLWAIPGAIKAYVRDINHDGLPDILALFAQAREGIYAFVNKGNNNFERRELLSFPPVYGSSYFELSDMNNDGVEDIIYTCGDNADYSSNALKNYHGIYIFIQQKNGSYTQQFFFAQHGSYKAIAADFDGDGDKDMIAISFFPDNENQPQESLIYLENTGNLHFKPFSVKGFEKGRWLTLDVGDADGDGDIDALVGSMQTQPRNGSAPQIAALYLENKKNSPVSGAIK